MIHLIWLVHWLLKILIGKMVTTTIHLQSSAYPLYILCNCSGRGKDITLHQSHDCQKWSLFYLMICANAKLHGVNSLPWVGWGRLLAAKIATQYTGQDKVMYIYITYMVYIYNTCRDTIYNWNVLETISHSSMTIVNSVCLYYMQ